MIAEHEFDRLLASWLETEGPQDVPTHLVEGALATARRQGQLGGWLDGLLGRRWPADPTGIWSPTGRRIATLLLAGLVAAGLIGGALFVGGGLLVPLPTESPTAIPSSAIEATATPTPVPTPTPAPTPTPEPHGLIAYSMEHKLYTIDPDGGEPAPLTNFGDQPIWSPDGTRVAFSGAGLQTVGLDGQAAPSDGISAEFPVAWSPDGMRLVVMGDRGGYRVVDWRTGEETELYPDSSIYASVPAWSPNGDELVITSAPTRDPPSNEQDLYVVAADGSNARQITATGATRDFDGAEVGPQWSPDGRWIAYTFGGWCEAGDCPFELRIIAPEGGEPRSLAAVRDGLVGPAWSPDGRSLLYGDKGGALIVPIDGGPPTRITDRALGIDDPCGCNWVSAHWSPDGSRVAFLTKDGLWVIDADGSHERLVVPGNVSSFDW